MNNIELCIRNISKCIAATPQSHPTYNLLLETLGTLQAMLILNKLK